MSKGLLSTRTSGHHHRQPSQTKVEGSPNLEKIIEKDCMSSPDGEGEQMLHCSDEAPQLGSLCPVGLWVYF